MSSKEKRGVSLWFILVAVAVGLLSGFLVNNMKLLDKEKVSHKNPKIETSIQEKEWHPVNH